MKVILCLLRALTRTLTRRVKPEILTAFGSNIADQIPKDIHTVVDHYDLDPSCRSFIACPQCHALYPLTNDVLSANEDAYAGSRPFSSCSSKSHPDSPECGTILWKTRSLGPRTFLVPAWKQVFQNLKDWIGKLLAVPGVEESLTECLRRNVMSDAAQDFWDSPIFKEFRGPDGELFMKEHFDISGSPELRLIMSLGFDSFNPFHMKASGGLVSSTAMYMVLLNLPEHLRYHQEYMFLVTVMHGHPNEDQVNHTLQKVVDELLLLWDGVFYTQTAKYSRGRTVCAALVPAVCDTQGAHTLSGFASHRHTLFCIRCLLPIQEIHNLDPARWPRRDLESHRTYANLWRDAASKAIRDTLFNKYGVRWTEMLRLPYWNPIVYTIIDSMHLGYLGLFATHIRRIWKMNAEALKSGEGYVQPSSEKKCKKPSNSFLRKLFNAIRDNKLSLKKTLSDQTQGVLWYLCYDLNLPSAGTKDILVNTILEWVSTIQASQGLSCLPKILSAKRSAQEMSRSSPPYHMEQVQLKSNRAYKHKKYLIFQTQRRYLFPSQCLCSLTKES